MKAELDYAQELFDAWMSKHGQKIKKLLSMEKEFKKKREKLQSDTAKIKGVTDPRFNNSSYSSSMAGSIEVKGKTYIIKFYLGGTKVCFECDNDISREEYTSIVTASVTKKLEASFSEWLQWAKESEELASLRQELSTCSI